MLRETYIIQFKMVYSQEKSENKPCFLETLNEFQKIYPESQIQEMYSFVARELYSSYLSEAVRSISEHVKTNELQSENDTKKSAYELSQQGKSWLAISVLLGCSDKTAKRWAEEYSKSLNILTN